MKKIAVVTATRAEYGLLSPVIKQLRSKENEGLLVEVIVTGTHLSEQYGLTVNDIQERIDYKIIIPVESANELNISENQAETLVKFTKLFKEKRYDAIMLLGDRYETLAIAIAAGNTRTPIIHLCGGDTTEGAMDEWIRHSITKISYLHFVTNEQSRRRVIQLGENPDRVFNYGSTSIDNIMTVADMGRKEALEAVGLDDCKYALCTYHPVTLDDDKVDEQIEEFLASIKAFPDIQFIVMKSNADQGGARINSILENAKGDIKNIQVFSSLGIRLYLSLMKFAEFVIGNSSSGIIEAPAVRVPTVNIGDRQRGRLQSESIINCSKDKQSIIDAINKAMSLEHKEICERVVSLYGYGHAAEKIANKIIEVVIDGRIDLKKKFYDQIPR